MNDTIKSLVNAANLTDAMAAGNGGDARVSLTDAIGGLLDYFHEPAIDEEGMDCNALAFQQEGVLSALCYFATRQQEQAGKFLKGRLSWLNQSVRRFDDSEIARNNLEKANAQVERAKMQKAAVDDFAETVLHEYRMLTGADWQPYRSKAVDPAKISDAGRAALMQAQAHGAEIAPEPAKAPAGATPEEPLENAMRFDGLEAPGKAGPATGPRWKEGDVVNGWTYHAGGWLPARRA